MTVSKPVLHGLAWAGVLIISSVMFRFAQTQHALTSDSAERGIQIIIGLTLAIYANFMTKQPNGHPANALGGRLQTALRISAWLFCISGLIYAAGAVFASHPFDDYLAKGAVGTALLVSVGFFIRACASRTA